MKLKNILLGLSIQMLVSLPAFAEKKISVLPFEVLSQKEDMKQFGIGTTDTLTHALSNVPEFIMVDRGQLNQLLKEQAFQKSGFSDSKETIELGKIVGADILVFGSIQSFENEYRINAHFTDVKTGKILKTVLVTGNNIFKLQDQLASELIRQQDVKLSVQQQEVIKNITQATDNTIAYDYYIKGRTAYLSESVKGYKEAISYYDKALETDKNYVLALSAKAEAQAHLVSEYALSGVDYQSLLKEAEDNSKLALSLNDSLSETHRSLSLVYNIKGDYTGSKIEAEKALKINPNDAETYSILWLVNSYSNGEFNFDPNDKMLLKSLQLNPGLIRSHINLSSGYIKQGDFLKANEEAKIVTKLSPDNMYGHFILGSTYISMGKYEDAEKAFKKALEISPNNEVALTGMANLYSTIGKHDEAIVSLKQIISNFPLSFGAHLSLGIAYFNKEQLDDAEREINISTKIFPTYLNFPSVIMTLAFIHKEQGNYEKAITEFKRVIELEPTNEHVHYALGVIYQKQNKFAQAIDEFKKVTTIKRKDLKSNLSSSYLTLGNNLYKEGKIIDAINLYKNANESNPEDVNIRVNLGAAYYSNKQFDESVNEYLKAITLDPKRADIYYNLGIVYQTQGKTELANEQYKKSCDLGLKSACH